MKFDCSTFHYKSRPTDQAAGEIRIKEICETRARYGYRHVHVCVSAPRGLRDQHEEDPKDLQ